MRISGADPFALGAARRWYGRLHRLIPELSKIYLVLSSDSNLRAAVKL
jgi:hypothetical protein